MFSGRTISCKFSQIVIKKVISFFSSETLSSVLLGKEQSFLSVTVRCFHLMIFMTSYYI